MKKFDQYKKEAEDKIHKILMDFQNQTGINVSWVEFKTESSVGFSTENNQKTIIKVEQ